jgi:uncharacterized phage-associated protein
MTRDGRAIANFVLDHADRLGVSVTNLSLQKLVYFCHVWSLIEFGKPLIRHRFEAWEYGPVLQYLYREFKVFGNSAIRDRARWLDPFSGRREVVPYAFDAATIALLARVVAFYGRLSSKLLVDLTHAEGGPWHQVWNQGGRINPGMRIDDREIVRFYARIPKPLTLQ